MAPARGYHQSLLTGSSRMGLPCFSLLVSQPQWWVYLAQPQPHQCGCQAIYALRARTPRLGPSRAKGCSRLGSSPGWP